MPRHPHKPSRDERPRKDLAVGPAEEGFRADRALSTMERALGRRDAKALFRAGLVLLNGVPAKGNEHVHPGDTLSYPDPLARTNQAEIARKKAPRMVTRHGRHVGRLYEDAELVVLNKPAEVPVMRGDDGQTRRETLEEVLRRAYPPPTAAKLRKIDALAEDDAADEAFMEEDATTAEDDGFNHGAFDEDEGTSDTEATTEFDEEDTPPPSPLPAGLRFTVLDDDEDDPAPPIKARADADGPRIDIDADDGRAAPPPPPLKRKPGTAKKPADEEAAFVRRRKRASLVDQLPDAPARDEAPAAKPRRAKPKAPPQGFYFVHRLDMETTGVLLVAKNEAARNELARQFAHREVHKTYFAFVTGEVPWEQKLIRRPIVYVTEKQAVDGAPAGRGHGNAPAWVQRKLTRKPLRAIKKGAALEEGEEGGKAAETMVFVQERFAGYTLLRCEPHSGRMHQLRIHLAAEGFPLAYDPLYGRATPLRMREFQLRMADKPEGEEVVLNRLPLHASKLSFVHPQTGETMTVESAMARDLKEFRKILRKFRRKDWRGASSR